MPNIAYVIVYADVTVIFVHADAVNAYATYPHTCGMGKQDQATVTKDDTVMAT